VVGWLGWTLGLLERPRPVSACELRPWFGWERLRRDDWVVAGDPVASVRGRGA
jgi:hypothetical protein